MRVAVVGVEKGTIDVKYLYFFGSSTFLDLRWNGSQIHDRKVISLDNSPERRSKWGLRRSNRKLFPSVLTNLVDWITKCFSRALRQMGNSVTCRAGGITEVGKWEKIKLVSMWAMRCGHFDEASGRAPSVRMESWLGAFLVTVTAMCL